MDNKKDEGVKISKKIQYSFNLLFRSSIDGLSAQVFHHKCDNKGATIFIAKISNSNMLVGGYNPRDWKGQCYKSTLDSFIFSISDLTDLQSARLGRVIDCNKAICCNNNYGPIFGLGHDLHALNNSKNWQYIKASYPNIGIPIH
ncbi:23770_t:CDS:1, partial [Gigaspora rosea]